MPAPPTPTSSAGSPAYDGPATVEEAVSLTLARLGRRMRHRMAGEELDMGAVLLLKALHGRPMRLTELAAVVDLDASTVSRQVRNLEAGGLVERTEDPTDRRATVLALAEKGRTRLRAGAARRRRAIAALVADWPDHDREQLRRLLARLLQELDRQESP